MGNLIKQHLELLAPSAEITPNNFEEIVLSEEETAEALRKARQEKYFQSKAQEWLEKIKSQPTWFTPTAEEYWNALLRTTSKAGGKFQVPSESYRKLAFDLCCYFSNDSRFSGDPKKGIMLMGSPGCGKTHLMNFFCKNPKASYAIPTCKTIVERYSTNWNHEEQSTIEFYSDMRRAENLHPWDQKELGYCFGDLGAEVSEAANYGNKRNVMEEIVFNRYEAGYKFYFTHFTTNLNPDELEKKYGLRFRDRIREMCNVFSFNNESFRK